MYIDGRFTDGADSKHRIVCAANKVGGTLILGVRHHDEIMRYCCKKLDGYAEQGFVDNRGQFLTREEAWPIALAAGQIIRRCGGDGVKLYSENLY